MSDETDLSDRDLAALAKEVAHRLERRGVLQAGTGAAAGGIAGYLATGRASAADTSAGNVGSAGNSADVFLDQLRDPGGDEVLDVDDTGTIVSQRGFQFPTVALKQVEETTVTANTGTSYTIDLTTGTVFDLTLTGDVTFSFTGSGDATGTNSFTAVLTQDGTGGRTVTWPSSVVWNDGAAPTISSSAGATDVLTFFTPDEGTTWYGMVGGQAFA